MIGKIFGSEKKAIAKILGNSVTDQAIRKHVSDNHKQLICCKAVHEYMKGIRVPCKYCNKVFLNKETLKTIIKYSIELKNNRTIY